MERAAGGGAGKGVTGELLTGEYEEMTGRGDDSDEV